MNEIFLNMKEIGYVPEVEEWDEIVAVLEDDLLTVQERKYFLGKLFLAEEAWYEQFKRKNLEGPREEEQGEWIVNQYGVSKKDIKQYAKFAIGIDAVAEIIPEFKSLILRMSEEVSGRRLNEIAKLSPITRKMIQENIQRRKLVVHPDDYRNEEEKKEFLVLQFE